MISDISLQNEVVLFDHFVLVNHDLSDFSYELFNCNDLFFDDWDLNDFLLDDWNLDDFFSDGFNDLIDLDNNWVVDNQLNNLRDLNDLFVISFNFIDSWNFAGNSDDLFNDIWNLDDLLNS